ncbi:hypothetical protein DESC_740053 [Desulfosarcina cetonica]|nr:hypothetical protein DESC_740053 [Desulfosarcina cetonica]
MEATAAAKGSDAAAEAPGKARAAGQGDKNQRHQEKDDGLGEFSWSDKHGRLLEGQQYGNG